MQDSSLEGIALLERMHATFSKAVTTNSSQLGCRVGTQATDQRLSRLGKSQRCREFTSPKTELLSHKMDTGIQKNTHTLKDLQYPMDRIYKTKQEIILPDKAR